MQETNGKSTVDIDMAKGVWVNVSPKSSTTAFCLMAKEKWDALHSFIMFYSLSRLCETTFVCKTSKRKIAELMIGNCCFKLTLEVNL